MNSQINALLGQAVQHFEQGKLSEAEQLLQKVLQLHAKNFDALHILGVVKGIQNDKQEAIKLLKKAVAIDQGNNFVHFNLAKTLSEAGKEEESLPHHKKATQLAPQHAEAWLNYGRSLNNQRRFEDALACYERALSVNPYYADAWSNYGATCNAMERYEDALSAYDKALSITPEHAESWSNSGVALQALERYAAALGAYQKALSINPMLPETWVNYGTTLKSQDRLEEALAAFDQALKLDTQSIDAWYNKGISLSVGKRYQEAMAAYINARAINPDFEQLQACWLRNKMLLCDWTGLDDAISNMKTLITQKRTLPDPFSFLAMSDDPMLTRQCAELYSDIKRPDKCTSLHWLPVAEQKKIRIGYYSADFHNHATTYLMAELFEKHDRHCFELIGFSYGPDATDRMRQRVAAAMDKFIDVRHCSDAEIVSMSRDMGIDIAVDLKGHTQDARMGIFAYGAAPVQVSYLGYPGTLGAPYIDYIIGDKVVTPDTAAAYYSEQIIRLPHSYQVNDRTRAIEERNFTRNELGLPEDAFVFACFNNNYKISPQVFDIWMRILGKVAGSVLWLFGDNPAVIANLRAEAEQRGIATDRLVFAPQMELALHLARHRQADLFLDTYNYNAHTTASDALWTGLPVLTRIGNTFSGRVAASLLNAVGLPELVTTSVEEYEELAVALATNHELLAGYRQRLLANRLTAPLFDSGLFTRHIEDAYRYMHQRRIAGLPPAAYDVPA